MQYAVEVQNFGLLQRRARRKHTISVENERVPIQPNQNPNSARRGNSLTHPYGLGWLEKKFQRISSVTIPVVESKLEL